MLKIFLAEDEVVVRETIKRMIPWEELGFELVGEAADGEDGGIRKRARLTGSVMTIPML